MPDTAISSDVARQQKLQQQFTSQRRKDMLDMQASNIDRVPERNDAKEILKTQSKPGGKRKLSTHHYTRGARRKHKRDMAKKALELAPASALTQESQAVAATAEQASDDPATILAQLEPTTDKEKGGTIEVPSQTEPQVETPKETNTKAEGNVTTDNTLHDPPVSTANTKDPTEKPKSIPKESKPKAGPKNSGSKKAPSKSKKKPTAENKKTAPTEAERKAQLAKRLDVEEKKIAKTFRKCESETKRPLLSVISKHKIDAPAQVLRKVQSKKRIPATEISDVEGFESFQSALGGKTTKIGTTIEKADAAKLEILRKLKFQDFDQRLMLSAVEVDQPPVPSLSYGLERVLFKYVREYSFLSLILLTLCQSWCLSTPRSKIPSVQFRPLLTKDHACC